jgi:hypothetical protein
VKVQVALTLAFLSLSLVVATAQTQEEQDACTNDAFTVCGEFIPDRDRVAACLAHNISKISIACRTVMLSYQKPQTTAVASMAPMNIKPKRAARIRAIRTSCKTGASCGRMPSRQQAKRQ